MPTRTYNNLGKRIALAGGFQIKNGASFESGTGFPISGTAGTTVRSGLGAPPGSLYLATTNDVLFVNEGTAVSPYWTPVSMDQHGLVGVDSDFNRFVTKAGSDTATIYYSNGVRVFGLGLGENDANTGQTASFPVGGPILTAGADNQSDYNVALGYGSTTALWTPNVNGTMVIDATFTGITDILTRTFFAGFSGESIDALVTLVKGATVTMTFSPGGTTGDDVHGLFMGSALTAASTIFLPTVKANASASRTTTEGALTVAATMPAAATYTRWRVEIDTAGNLYAFVNKVLVKTVSVGATPGTALAPVFQMANTTTTASLSMAVRQFGAWAAR